MTDHWVIRDPVSADAHLILQTYGRGTYAALRPSERSVISEDRWRELARVHVALALEHGEVKVAAWPDGDTVLGYAVGFRMELKGKPAAVIEWLWTKEYYRRRGVARSLMRGLAAGADKVAIGMTRKPEHVQYARKRGWAVWERIPWLRTLERITE